MSGEDLHLQTSPTKSKTTANVDRTFITKNTTIASATKCAQRTRTVLPMNSPPALTVSTSSLAGRSASLDGSNPGGEDLRRLYKMSLLDELAMNQSPGTNNLLGGHLLHLNPHKITTPTMLGACVGVGSTEKSAGSPTLDATSSVMGSLKMLDQLILSSREASLRRQMELLQRMDALGLSARHYSPLPTSITSPLNLSSALNFAGNRAISNQPYDILSNALVSSRTSAAGGTTSTTTMPVNQGGEKDTRRQLNDLRTARRPPRVLYMQSDNDSISPYQCLVRKQIEIFEATEEDTSGSAQGRNRPIVLGQVGIRCVHCGKQSNKKRTRGSVYFPSTMLSTYQTAQNMANCHLAKECTEIPRAIREDIIRIRLSENGESKNTRKSAFGGGRKYWASGLVALGIEESADRRLRYSNKNREL